ncbi:hypothetical protein THASP1DRAFT_29335 [Thamnocephalis sphaerospora]|uniref:F-box domain-containing protein n=1 Tax=Thamnocephalis sphaerospora TaxID=78915 RepID=A0A4P9XSC3_9FUNG|nr:hypothetical protein THASP1DRAFT_29335 [Thamnocephalis sphaerospora]|eukprot:RKP08872.1 hypothetical protein THASP1DRAFT_29335 [Thamnocephalis sphaerospora]
MNRVPNEVIDCVVELSTDEAALALLSCTSRRLRACVAARQSWWQERFKQHFPQNDDKEEQWLRLHVRTQKAVESGVGGGSRLSFQRRDSQFDWFDAYCRRRAIEYRWRHGLYTLHLLADATDIRPNGTRLQSIPLVSVGSSLQDATVASQWRLPSQQQPTWIMERLCWDYVRMEHMVAVWCLWSEEYLVIQVKRHSAEPIDSSFSSLYAWHFAALHRPPRPIIVNQCIYYIDMRKSWLAVQYKCTSRARQATTVVHDLSKEQWCSDILGNVSSGRIQNIAAHGVYIVRVGHNYASGPTLVGYQLWKAIPGQDTSFQCQAKGNILMDSSGPGRGIIVSRRIDDTRFIIWIRNSANLASGATPNLVLVKVSRKKTGTTLTEKWAINTKGQKVWSVVSRNLLLVTKRNKPITLLNLDDGAVVHNVILDCWYYSGLYPPKGQWERMANGTMWLDPREDIAPGDPQNTEWQSSPTSILVSADNSHFLADYATEYLPRPRRGIRMSAVLS